MDLTVFMTWIGGIATVIGAIYGVRTYHLTRRGLAVDKPEPKPRRPFWTTVTIAVLVGLVWLVIAIHYFSATHPNLQAEVEAILGAQSPTDDDRTIAIISLNISNIGAVQSTVRKWHVSATANGLFYDGIIKEVPDGITLTNPKDLATGQPDTISFNKDDDLTDEDLEPIHVGDIEYGIVYVEFSPKISAPGDVQFTITFEDLFSDKYAVTEDIDARQLMLAVKLPDKTSPPSPSVSGLKK